MKQTTMAKSSFLFVNATKIYQFKTKDSETKIYTLHLRKILADFSANNMKKIGLNRCVCNFSVDYTSDLY